jgi:hypothetical protein
VTDDNITRAGLNNRREQVKRFRRNVSEQVINTYREITLTIGQAPAIDYHRITGGQNAQFAAPKNGMFTAIDFTADVENTVRATLQGADRRWYTDLLKTDREFLEYQTDAELAVHELMGRAYVEREMYPITGYLTS